MPLVKNFINGEWVESKGDIKDVVNLVTGETIAKVPISIRDEMTAAIEAAKEAFPDWRATPPIARARSLFRLKELLEENFEELSRIQTQEHGKTIDESRGEMRRGIENVEVASQKERLVKDSPKSLQDVGSTFQKDAPLALVTT